MKHSLIFQHRGKTIDKIKVQGNLSAAIQIPRVGEYVILFDDDKRRVLSVTTKYVKRGPYEPPIISIVTYIDVDVPLSNESFDL